MCPFLVRSAIRQYQGYHYQSLRGVILCKPLRQETSMPCLYKSLNIAVFMQLDACFLCFGILIVAGYHRIMWICPSSETEKQLEASASLQQQAPALRLCVVRLDFKLHFAHRLKPLQPCFQGVLLGKAILGSGSFGAQSWQL